MECYTKKFAELSSKEINQIKKLIIEGGEVDTVTLDERFSKVERVSFYIENEEVVSTASIKKPTVNYRKNTFTKSKSNVNNEDFKFELGYISTNKDFTGQKLASKLCFKLCELYPKNYIFSTTKIDNERMMSILAKNNFKETGEKFLNKKGTDFLKLYLKV